MNTLAQKIYQAACRDGLLEIFLGGYLLLVAAVLFSNPKLLVFTVFLIFLLRPLLERLKEKYVYARVGYVKLMDENEKEVQGIIVTTVMCFVLMVVSLVLLVIIKGHNQGRDFFMRWLFPALSAGLFTFGPAWLAKRFGLRKYYILVVLIPLLGLFLSITGLATGYRAIGFISITAGIFAIISGGIQFRSFLKDNPVPREADE